MTPREALDKTLEIFSAELRLGPPHHWGDVDKDAFAKGFATRLGYSEEAAAIGAADKAPAPGGALGYLIQVIEAWDRDWKGSWSIRTGDFNDLIEEARAYVVETSE